MMRMWLDKVVLDLVKKFAKGSRRIWSTFVPLLFSRLGCEHLCRFLQKVIRHRHTQQNSTGAFYELEQALCLDFHQLDCSNIIADCATQV
jgi:hypothetical protein